MKPVDFAYEQPRSIADAISLLGAHDAAKILAGGQTLGPMLNLRFAQPDVVIDIMRIAELSRIEEMGESVVLGACITHAAIEDGRVPDPAHGMLTRVAERIAYRAVRTRGTIGGSLAHADPAADWLSCLTALDASVSLSGSRGRRTVKMTAFVRGVMETDLGADEIIDGVEIPRLSPGARWGYHKICRKTGEFAEAIGAVVVDRDRVRIVAGATTGRLVVIDADAAELVRDARAPADLAARLKSAGLAVDSYGMKIHTVAVRRAIEEAVGGKGRPA